MLSKRGAQKAQEPLRPDFELFEKAQANPYAPDNTDGAIPLCIAENLLQWPTLRDKLQSIAAERDWPDWVAAYTELAGAPDFREAVAAFVGRHIAGQQLSADHFCVSAGATAVVEVSAMVLGGPEDYAVFPAPAYQAYAPDLHNKARLRRYDIRHYEQDFGPAFHPLSIKELEAALDHLGDKFRLLILTQPDNPTGAIYSDDQLRSMAKWCTEKEIHLVVNEIYALSQFERGVDGIPNESAYTSFLPLLEEMNSPYLHWWYSFSKDFGISGFRVGLLYTRNEEMRRAYKNFNAPHQVSNITQWLLAELLNDGEWIADFQRRNKRLLTDAYRTVTESLDAIDVAYTPARGSLFVWADFSGFLSEPNMDAAQSLWQQLFEETGVLLTAPGGLGQPDAGWFRIVYSGVSPEALREAMDRLQAFFSDRT
ncbi:1-aminocyclopropane-1-carboxylate synthase [Neolewinella xylanilytica]|uniref:Aminotransferase n=1 Tax=Neolewinella xylanilytica TaxID=1514080 RepID=A0A2S6I9U6_9BACT|nr:aminotransferase class I/II-fold pyridoxal phosphate-dependent enzyme [Neolewinella xylanilytica]PPK88258.1 1-aminocyclopropane-1-carboxylate synthase [Neolewinella xylanilytica]